MKYVINPDYLDSEEFLKDIIINFETKGTTFGNQKRNSLKLFDLDGVTINVKSFRVPNIINQFVYRFFRKSKAQRSFEYANKLLELNIGTPEPIAYFELPSAFLFKKSFYVSKHLDCDLTYRELGRDLEYPNHEIILRLFTRFTYKMHQNNINFLDHSPGNTLIKRVGDTYNFYLVDLNRMEFKPLLFEDRVKNFRRLCKHESMVRTMSDQYAKCIGEPFERVFKLMWSSTQDFQEKIQKKKRIKTTLKFWKK